MQLDGIQIGTVLRRVKLISSSSRPRLQLTDFPLEVDEMIIVNMHVRCFPQTSSTIRVESDRCHSHEPNE